MANDNLTPPPKFGSSGNAQGPETVDDWRRFYRWLIGLWRKAENSTTDQQVQAYIPPHTRGLDVGTVAGIATVFDQAHRSAPLSQQQIVPRGSAIPPQQQPIAISSRQPTPRPPDTGIEGMLLAASFRQSSIAQHGTSPSGVGRGVVVQGHHDSRISVGTGSITGNVLTWATGPNFLDEWVNGQIAINGALFSVNVFTSGTSITLGGAPPAGACGWEFMLYPANSLPAGSAFMETDHKVIYHNGDSAGTANLSHSTLTWLTGPLFSPYWGGLAIVIAGVQYIVSFSTQTTLTLTTDSGLVTAGAAWSVLNSSWFYEAGIESMSLAQLTARTFTVLDDGYLASVFDYQHTLIYNGGSAQWAWGPGETGSKWLAPSANGSAPFGGPWAACDGTAALVFEIIAGVPQAVSVTTPDLRSDTFLRGGAFTGSADATSAPAFSGAGLAVSTEVGTHTHSITAAPTTTESAAHQHPFGATANAQPYATGTPVVAPINIASENATHTHLLTAASSVESATHNHTITGSGAVSAPVVGAGAPKSYAFLWYMRQ